MYHLFANKVKTCPDDSFIYHRNRWHSFLDINKNINKYSYFLSSIVEHGAYVGILLNNQLDLLKIYFSLLKLGAKPVFIYDDVSGDEILKFNKIHNINTVITIEHYSSKFTEADIKVIFLDGIAKEKDCIIHYNEDFFDTSLMNAYLFTSGSTGEPKLVSLKWENFNSSALAWGAMIPFKSNELYLCCIKLYHIAGLSIISRSLIYGMQVILLDYYNSHTITSVGTTLKPKYISIIPKMFYDLVDDPDGLYFLSRLGVIILGGDIIHNDLIDFSIKNNLNLFISYGMTETASGVCGQWVNSKNYKKYSIGRPFPGVDLNIHDSGCLEISGKMVASNNSDLTLKKNKHLSSDLVEIDGDGFLYFKGRNDNIALSGGKKIYIKKVEKVFLSHPDILSLSIDIGESKIWGQNITVFIKSVRPLSIPNLKKWLLKYLKPYEIPKKIKII